MSTRTELSRFTIELHSRNVDTKVVDLVRFAIKIDSFENKKITADPSFQLCLGQQNTDKVLQKTKKDTTSARNIYANLRFVLCYVKRYVVSQVLFSVLSRDFFLN